MDRRCGLVVSDMIEFSRRWAVKDRPFPLGLRGVGHDPRNLEHLAMVEPPTPSPTPNPVWHRTTASVFHQQGSSCTAQAAVGMLITLPFRYQFQPDRAGYDTETERHQLYLDAQAVDPWPGGEPDYEGSSIDAPLRILRDRSVIARWRWLIGEPEVWEWLTWYGPAVMGTRWKRGMFYPDGQGYIHPTGDNAGGHAYELCYASVTRQAYRVINSWGVGWGQNGRCWLKRQDLAQLLAEDGEAVTI